MLAKNLVGMSVSGIPGTGSIALGGAEAGHQSFAAAYAGNATVDVRIEDGDAWEIARDCAYTHAGATLTRGTLEASSTGSALALSASAKVLVIDTAERINQRQLALRTLRPGGRLTLTAGTPVTTADVIGATSLYYTPSAHDVIPLWDGSDWRLVRFSETTLALGSLTNGLPYDVFGYLSGGTLALERLPWTSATARAVDISLQDGMHCKAGDHSRLYLGTFLATSATATEDSMQNRCLWNKYNQTLKKHRVSDGTYHTYTNTTARHINGVPTSAKCITGQESTLDLSIVGRNVIAGANTGTVGIGIDSSSEMLYKADTGYQSGQALNSFFMEFLTPLGAGAHTVYLLEIGGSNFSVAGAIYTGNIKC